MEGGGEVKHEEEEEEEEEEKKEVYLSFLQICENIEELF